MKTVAATLRGISPMSQSRQHDTPLLEKEGKDAHEKRTWREKLHYDAKGMVFIPPMALKMALDEVAQMMGRQIPGKGKSTYTKHFRAGVLCMEPAALNVHKDELEGEWINANSDGVRGSGKRVKRCFPKIPEGWSAKPTFVILDDTITKQVFEDHLKEAGTFVGIGRFRPKNGGFYGRFTVEKFEWS